jgi:hypothetical protein
VTLVAGTLGGALETSAPPRGTTGLERLRLAPRALRPACADVRLRTLRELRAIDGPERAEREVAQVDADGLVVRLDLLAGAQAGAPEPPRWPAEAIAAAAAELHQGFLRAAP